MSWRTSFRCGVGLSQKELVKQREQRLHSAPGKSDLENRNTTFRSLSARAALGSTWLCRLNRPTYTNKPASRGLFHSHMEIDFASAAWVQVARWAQQRVDALRLKNDGALTPEETAHVRGQIRAFKSLLGLPEDAARARSAGSVDDSFGG